MFHNFPKVKNPLPDAYQAIYEEHYKSNRSGEGVANGMAQKLERWLHHKVAKDTKDIGGYRTLEIGAGTLNQISYEHNLSHYDIIEPFETLYQDSPKLQYVNAIYQDITQITENTYSTRGGDILLMKIHFMTESYPVRY
ncbi:hypothetical protein [uncultured Helicobacter sp.]|uniref:hypothetical protein n=1 Tax=uncultured Helicobacter sp. TaxID=175537 RepID=UPI00374F5CEE